MLDQKYTSWKPQVRVSGEGDRWHDNALRFATKEEAEKSARDLMSRWMLVTACQAAPSDDAVNYRWDDENGLILLAA